MNFSLLFFLLTHIICEFCFIVEHVNSHILSRTCLNEGILSLSLLGERPHRCSMCGKTFTTKDTLNKHLTVHSTERQYKCGECGKLFKRISHVREHLKVHSNDRPYVCNMCNKTFKTVVSLYRRVELFLSLVSLLQG